VAAESTNVRDECIGNKEDVGATPHPLPGTYRTWSPQHGVERLRETGG
jgi:hypothetical protein